VRRNQQELLDFFASPISNYRAAISIARQLLVWQSCPPRIGAACRLFTMSHDDEEDPLDFEEWDPDSSSFVAHMVRPPAETSARWLRRFQHALLP